jgi:predicted nuclease of predicted toxin-antitoxin system
VRILANENFPGEAVTALQERGHDVVWVRTDAPASSDHTILERAQVENRVVITFDKDFGEMAFRWGLPASSGIILLRIPTSSPARVASTAVAVLETRTDWVGQFAVVEEDRIRMTLMPPRQS